LEVDDFVNQTELFPAQANDCSIIRGYNHRWRYRCESWLGWLKCLSNLRNQSLWLNLNFLIIIKDHLFDIEEYR